MNVRRGEVVMVGWPYSDGTGTKVRPAVVVQADVLNAKIDDTVLLAVTRTSRGAVATEVPIDPADEPDAGLLYPSVVTCSNFLTLDQGRVIRAIGTLSDAAMRRIEAAVRSTLDLP